MPTRKLGIVADDLTGAMDSSGYFAQRGLSTEVILDPEYSSSADVVVVTTNSRAEHPETARARVLEAVRRLSGRMVYKKIDSTLRGNIGVEVLAAMEGSGAPKTIVAPAFPAVGRTTADGILLVNGTPVSQTQFANDPVSPVAESHIPTMIQQTTGRQVGLITIPEIEAGAKALHRHISGADESIFVCDVAEQGHLRTIVEANALAGCQWLLVGSGGMARELYLLTGKSEKRVAGDKRPVGPALAVIGSRNPVVIDQIETARTQLGLPLLRLEAGHFREDGQPSEDVNNLVAQARRLLADGRSLAVTSTFSQYVPGLKHVIPATLADAAVAALRSCRPVGIFLSGGDIAVAVCRKMSVSAISVLGEVEAGIPAGETVGGPFSGIRIVTKAGGFGTEKALIKSLTYLEKGCLT